MDITNINVRVEKSVKEKADSIFDELGLNMTTAINMFLRASIREHGIPFELKVDVPNRETVRAIEEGRRLLKDSQSPGYTSMEDLKKALLSD